MINLLGAFHWGDLAHHGMEHPHWEYHNVFGNHVENFALQGCDQECFEPLLKLHSHLVLGTLVINPLTLN